MRFIVNPAKMKTVSERHIMRHALEVDWTIFQELNWNCRRLITKSWRKDSKDH
jgi:hypothetical protein